jgi:hypothetical protein
MNDLDYYYTLPAVIDGVKAGKEFQYSATEGYWYTPLADDQNPESLVEYIKRHQVRLKPAKPEVRWWSKPEDVPGPMCWVRGPKRTHEAACSLIVSVSEDGICTTGELNGSASSTFNTWSALRRDEIEYSIDRRSWSSCCQTEGEQA